MKRSELGQKINETILEMLENGDEDLIALMKEHDETLSGEEVNESTFVEDTITVLKEHMGVEETEEAEVLEETEEVDPEEELMTEEINRMKELY